MVISKSLLILMAIATGTTLPDDSTPVTASAVSRSAPANANSLSVNANPVLGSELKFSVDVASTGHSRAQLFATALPATIVLGRGQVILLGGAQLYASRMVMGPVAKFSGRVPDDISFAGFQVSVQALHLSEARPFALSNAIDLTAGIE